MKGAKEDAIKSKPGGGIRLPALFRSHFTADGNFKYLIVVAAVLSYCRLLLLQNVFWDDNLWFLSLFRSDSLDEYLSTGWYQLRRVPNGIFLYYFFSLHKYTDFFFVAAHSINLAIQILIPVYLYLLIRNLSKGKETFAFFVAIVAVIYPIDTTVPIFSNINYRLGLLLTIMSFYLTERVVSGNARWPSLLTAFLLSGFSFFVLIEGMISLEPARVFIIAYTLFKEEGRFKTAIKRTLEFSAPFAALCVLLILYKLNFKPYGVYGGQYALEPQNLSDQKYYWRFLHHFFIYNWFKPGPQTTNNWHYYWVVFRELRPIAIPSVVLAVSGAVVSFYFLIMSFLSDGKQAGKSKSFIRNLMERLDFNLPVFFLAMLLLIPPFIMYTVVAGRIPSIGYETRHGIVFQVGYAIFFGWLFYFLYTCFPFSRLKAFASGVVLSILLGAGIFFNNFVLDMYFEAWSVQTVLWRDITSRLPSIPEGTAVNVSTIFRTMLETVDGQFDQFYDIEFPLNLLYARSDGKEDFKRAAISETEMYQVVTYDKPSTLAVDNRHLEKRGVATKDMLVVYFDNDSISFFGKTGLTNSPASNFSYPLRHKYVMYDLHPWLRHWRLP